MEETSETESPWSLQGAYVKHHRNQSYKNSLSITLPVKPLEKLTLALSQADSQADSQTGIDHGSQKNGWIHRAGFVDAKN